MADFTSQRLADILKEMHPQLVQEVSEAGRQHTAQAAGSLIQQIEAVGGAIIGAVSELPLPAPAAGVLRIIQLLLPTVVGTAGILWPDAGSQPQAQPAAPQPQQGGQPAGQQPVQPGQPQAGQQPQPGQQTAQQPVQPSATPGQSSPQDLADDKAPARSDMPRRGPGA